MILNDATPVLEVDPETYEMRADGELLTCEPANVARAAVFPVLTSAGFFAGPNGSPTPATGPPI